MGDKGGNEILKQQVHQFRYVISAQQAQWVRDNYKKDGMTDEEALAEYLSTMEEGDGVSEYNLEESARAHNKGQLKKNSDGEYYMSYPGGSNANYKVTIGFHSEFIIDQEGNFLNEVDPESSTKNGVVNGASFNYANNNNKDNAKTHDKLDGNPIAPWDPEYRKKATKDYSAPNNLSSSLQDGWEDFWQGGNGKSWDNSYWNGNGVYGKDGMSSHDRVVREADGLRDMINEAKDN